MALLLEPPPLAPAPSDESARPVADRSLSRVVHRTRLLAVCLGFVALAMWQQPGRIVADTKLDLFVDPLAFLGRALRLWEPEGFSGQVQNQAYGYLFPMGPFFALGDLLGMPVWVVQRLWWAALLSAAFLGVVALTGQLRVGTPATRIIAGLAYALAPRMVSSLGAVSIEVLPMALAPWVLVVLVAGSRGGSPRRAGAAGGLVVFCVGGVNAAATAAVLPLGALWLLTRAPGPRRRRLMIWWTACTGLATAWWVVPLLLLGRYSPPFLDHIETAATTTAPGELAQALRGMTQWVAWLGTPAGPVWPAGSALLHETLPVLASVVLAALGLAALTRADLPHRRWLVLGALIGLALLTAGHLAAAGPAFDGMAAGPLRAALDGALAPLRNVHKFDPVLRLPLAIALAHVLGVALRAARRGSGARARTAAAVPVVAVLAVLGVATPALDGRLAASGTYLEVPGYWGQAADALAALDPDGRALLLPGSSFGVYLWGSPADEPLQPLADSPWTVRNAVPLTPAGYIRMLDVVEDRLARGAGGAGLTAYLARAGISHLVVRNDLDAGTAGATRSALVHRALADSPGLTRVATFGPLVNTGTALPGLVLDSGTDTPSPAVEVFAVAGSAPPASLTPLSGVPAVLGGPDAVGALVERDPWAVAPTVPAGDPSVATDGPLVVSDALVRRERTFGRIADAAGAALSARDPLRLDAPARDYLLPDHEAHESSVRYSGGVPAASSSASDPDSIGGARVEHQPYAALDGDPSTAWRPAVLLGRESQWWEVALDAPVSAAAVTVTLDQQTVPTTPSRVRVRTDAGELVVPLQRTADPQPLALPPGPTRTLRITADPPPGTIGGPRIGLAEVALPGVLVHRTLVTPVPDREVSTYAFDTTPARAGCVVSAAGPVRCTAALVRGAEEPAGLDRVFTVAVPAEYDVAVTAVPRPGPALDALLAPPPAGRREWPRPSATASSSAVPDPRGGPGAAVDADPTTVWTAAPGDPDPVITLSWDRPLTVDHLRVVLPPGTAAARPTAVTVSGGGQQWTVGLEPDGTARFAPITTDRLSLRFPLAAPLTSFDPYTRGLEALGVGVAEVEVPGLGAPDPATAVEVPCGAGPTVRVDGRATPTSVRTTVGDLRALRPVRVTPCGPTGTGELAAGEHTFTATGPLTGTAAFTAVSATLTAIPADTGTAAVAANPQPSATPTWDVEHRTVRVPARDDAALLTVTENANPGWVATLDGVELESTTVDGWQQGYVLPAGPAGTVELGFGPGTAYRGALLAGVLGVLAVLVLLVVPARGPQPQPARPGRRRTGVVVAAVIVTAVVGGVTALAALAALAYLGGLVGNRRRRPLLGAVAAAGVLGCGVLLAATGMLPFGAEMPLWLGEPARQVLGAVAVGAVAAALLPVPAGARRRSGTRPRQRVISGRSISR